MATKKDSFPKFKVSKDGKVKKCFSKGQKLAFRRYAKKTETDNIKSGKITEQAFPYNKISRPKRGNDGKWILGVTWKTTNEEPVSLFGNEIWMSKNMPCYKKMTADEVTKDLVKKQMENDKMDDAIILELTPETFGADEQKELDNFEAQFQEEEE